MILNQRIEKKRYIFEYYKKMLKDMEGIHMMPVNNWSKSNCWLSCILLRGKVKPLDIILALEKTILNPDLSGNLCICSHFIQDMILLGQGFQK